MYNPSQEAATLSIHWYGENGQLLNAVTPDPLAPGAHLVGTPEALGYPDQCDSCWFHIASTQPVTGFNLYGHTTGTDVAGYTVTNISGAEGILPGPARQGWTGIALVHVADAAEDPAAAVTLEALDAIGNVTATVEMDLPAFGKVVGVVEDLFLGQDLGAAEYVRYSSTSSRITAFQLRGAEDGATLAALPAMDATIVSSREEELKRLLPESLYTLNGQELGFWSTSHYLFVCLSVCLSRPWPKNKKPKTSPSGVYFQEATERTEKAMPAAL